ncbi:MAG: cupin domain-containing protein [Hyphomicrobium sp.]
MGKDTMMKRAVRLSSLLACVFIAAGASPLAADDAAQKPPAATQAAPGITRTILQKFDVEGTSLETTVMRVAFVPNFEVARHTHPGGEISYVLEGEITYLIDGQPPQRKVAGESVLLPAGTIHGAKMGPNGTVLIGTYVLDKGKPFMTKADAPPAP